MKKAYLYFREGLHYRSDAFLSGLSANSYQAIFVPFNGARQVFNPEPDDLLVIWNRYGAGDMAATKFEQAGARVVVAENGYLGKDWIGGNWYAMSLGHHNGAGVTPEARPERWASFGFELAQSRGVTRGEIVLLPQRGIGEPGVAMPVNWLENARKDYPGARVRQHPGKFEAVPVEEDCEKAFMVVTHGSGAGIKCMAAGIQCDTTWDGWIGASACGLFNESRRLAMFECLAWAMWRLDEIKSGYAFQELLKC